MSKIGNSQTIDPIGTNPVSTRAKCGYKFTPYVSTNVFQYWIVPSPNAYLVNEFGHPDANVFRTSLYVKWKNVEASANPCVLQVLYKDYLGVDQYVTQSFGPFTLTFETITFVGGSSRNIPCYATAPVTVALSNYVNTNNNYPYDKNEWITSQFELTLPSGWQTTAGQTGTFVGPSSIVVIPPVSNSTVNVSVRAKANTQYSQPSTLQITRNLENFSIGGSDAVTCYSTNPYTAPATAPGVTYTWQLPSGWTGVANGNSINATATGSSGTITCTMASCGLSKISTKTVTVNVVAPGTIIAGPDLVCSSGNQFSVNIPTGSSISWNPGPGITRVSPQGSNPCTFSSTGSASSWIDATVNGSCGNFPLPRKIVWAGAPATPTAIIPFWINGMEFGNDSYYEFHVDTQQGATSYNWIVGGGVITEGQGTNWITVKTNKIIGQSNINFAVSARAVNSCGSSNYFVRTGWVIPGTGGASLLFTPNPATEETILTIESDSKEITFDETAEWEVEVYDPLQNLKEKKTKLMGNSTKLQTAGWREGIYVARVKYKDVILTGRLVVK